MAALHQFRNFAATKVRLQENDRLREIHAAVVAQREVGLVQHAEEQLPEGVAGLLDFIE